MNSYSYFIRLETVLRSRQDINLEIFEITPTPVAIDFKSEVYFYDGSHLSIFERIKQVGKRDIIRIRYKFHYQDVDGNLIFRYDNAPHHPHLATFPDYKHIRNDIIETESPDLNDVLAEIDSLIYTDQ
ncbi:MAG: hypothetical protein DRI57_06940 [Deltaproteobacteria bacterium]|nr:MAG: hypothetical protein DRI57_06940 [Deltaproteobacteria bacterium]